MGLPWTTSSPAIAQLQPELDELVCLSTPEFFGAVGVHYADFRQDRA